MPALRLAVLSALLMFAGCGYGDPDAPIFFTGRVANGHGGILADTAVTLSRVPGCALSVRETGSSPASGQSLSEFATTRTNDAGEYRFQLMRVEAQPPSASVCFRVAASGEGAHSRLQASGTGYDLQFPDLIVSWGPENLAVTESDAGVEARLLGLPRQPSSDPGPQESVSHVDYFDWVALVGEDIAWRQRTDGGDFHLAPELVEDFQLATAVDWLTRDDLVAGSPVFRMHASATGCARSRQLPLARRSFVPVSRGAPCLLNGKPLEPCPLTDGLLGRATMTRNGALSGPGEPAPATLTIDLAAPAKVRMLVLRDLGLWASSGSAIAVEGSADGVSWAPLGTIPGEARSALGFADLGGGGRYLQLELSNHASPVQQVRLTTERGRAFSWVREISVFE